MNMRTLLAAITVFLCTLSHAASLSSFGAVGDGVTDTTPAFNSAVAALCASTSERTLHIAVGDFLFASAVNPIPCALNVLGEGPATTKLIRGYSSPSYFIKWVGGMDKYGGGSIRDLALDAGTASGGIALWVQAQLETDPTIESKNPHGLLIDNVLVGAGFYYPQQGSWGYGIYLDGSLNANPPAGVAPGIRFVRLRDVSVSRFSILPYLLDSARGTRITQADCFIPIGTASVEIYVIDDQGGTLSLSSCPFVRQ